MHRTERRLLQRLGLLIVALAMVGAGAPAESGSADREPTSQIVQSTTAGSYAGAYPDRGYSPGQVRHAYGIDRLAESGTGQVIGIITAFDSPAIPRNVQTFIESYHLPGLNGLPGTPACTVSQGPHPCFQRVYSQGPPSYQERWVTETCLNVDWAHAIAPGADVLAVESPRDDAMDMLDAVDRAVGEGARVIAMSWGSPEFADEALYDFHFQRPGVVFVTSTGDVGGVVNWPASSPYVISVGGSTLRLDPSGNVLSDSAWEQAGWGYSAYEPEPAYQVSAGVSDPRRTRAVPDVSYAANPDFGFPVYDVTSSFTDAGWIDLGGTSVGVPQWAGLIALADQRRPTHPLSSGSLTASPIYDAARAPLHWTNFRRVGTRSTAFDLTTGLGAPRVDRLVPSLAEQK